MTAFDRCPQCGCELPPQSPSALCPKCLLLIGLQGEASEPGALTRPSPAKPSGGFVPPTLDQLQPLFPQLEILELLGKGGMGAGYRARQRGLDRWVALKV